VVRIRQADLEREVETSEAGLLVAQGLAVLVESEVSWPAPEPAPSRGKRLQDERGKAATA
jgi:hypothetical protein